MAEEIEIYGLKTLSKEDRKEMVRMLRNDPSLWNALNGIGGLSKSSPNGMIVGNIYNESGAIQGAEVTIDDGAQNKETRVTNQYGHYEAELLPGDYTVSVTVNDSSSDGEVITVEAGVSEYYAYNPDETPKPPEEPETPEEP